MGIERIILEDHGNPALGRLQLIHLRAANMNAAVLNILETGDHAQQRRLSATRRPHEDGEFFLLDIEIDAVNDFRFAKSLPDGFQFDIAHQGTGCLVYEAV